MANAAFQMNKETQTPGAEGFKALRTNLVFAAEDKDCRMILLVSPQKDEKSPGLRQTWHLPWLARSAGCCWWMAICVPAR